MDMLRAAPALVSRDMAVFPCRQRSKLPATERGFLDASKDPAIVERWWRSDPNYNIGVATGAVSTGLLAVDIDGVDAELELRKLEADHGALPPRSPARAGTFGCVCPVAGTCAALPASSRLA